MSLMVIPTGGFGWVAGEDRVAPPGATECVLFAYAPDEHAVQARLQRCPRGRRNQRLRA